MYSDLELLTHNSYYYLRVVKGCEVLIDLSGMLLITDHEKSLVDHNALYVSIKSEILIIDRP